MDSLWKSNLLMQFAAVFIFAIRNIHLVHLIVIHNPNVSLKQYYI